MCSVQEEEGNKTRTVVTHPHIRDVTEEELQHLMETAPASVSTIVWSCTTVAFSSYG